MLEDRLPARPPAVPGTLHSYTLTCPRSVTAPKLCRESAGNVVRFLEHWHLVDAAMLCTSEVATNTFLHADGATLLMLIGVRPTLLRITVLDGCPGVLPGALMPDPEASNGRGLALVAALADRSGPTGDPRGQYAKGFWFELGTAQAAAG
jgi:hypothetical protein